ALTEPGTCNLYRPAVQLDQALDERKADSESALRMIGGGIELREGLKESRKRLPAQADARVLDRHAQLIFGVCRRKHDPAAPIRIFGRVREQVRKRLRESERIGLQAHRLSGQADLEHVLLGIDQR